METQSLEQSHKPFVPWNKGKVTGQKSPLKPREVGPFVCGSKFQSAYATWRSST